MNIQRTKAKPVGIDPNNASLIHLHVYINATPDADWRAIFEHVNDHLPAGRSELLDTTSARFIARTTILLVVPEGQIRTYLQKLDARTTATNAAYAREVVPARERRAKAQDEAEAQKRARLDAAQREADSL